MYIKFNATVLIHSNANIKNCTRKCDFKTFRYQIWL